MTTDQVAEHLNVDFERFSYATYRQHIRTLRRAFDAAEGDAGSFSARCRQGEGIVTFGDQRAYCWKLCG